MLVDTCIEKPPSWFSNEAPDGAMVLFCQCSLSRNLPDLPFVPQASAAEQEMVEERVLQVLENTRLLAQGRYYSLDSLEPVERRFLAERQLITSDLLYGTGSRGVWVASDQRSSIMLNALDHVTIRVLNTGMQVQECWERALELDTLLNDILGFAFDEELGYLCTQLRNVGTGMKANVLLHLPALSLLGAVQEQANRVSSQRLVLQGIMAGSQAAPERHAAASHSSPSPRQAASTRSPEDSLSVTEDLTDPLVETVMLETGADQALLSTLDGVNLAPLKSTLGDLYLLVNESTLGLSEDDICFHLRHAASKIMTEERGARKRLLKENRCILEDRVGRARGIAAGARLLGFGEGLQLLSSLRLGSDLKLLNPIKPQELNTIMLQSQGAQLEMTLGQTCDAYRLNMERATRFRDRFSMGLER